PRLAAVGAAIDALAAVPRIALRRGEHEIRILRVDHDLVDLDRVLEANMRPRLAGIDRFVHAVAERTLHRVASAGIHNVGIGRRHLYRADAVDVRELIENRRPRHARASGLPNAAGGRPDVKHARLTDRAGDGRDAPTVKRADVAPAETGKEVVVRSHI